MDIKDFEVPEEHPYEMLAGMGLKHTYEAESFFAWMLKQCVEAGGFVPISTKFRHPALVKAGLLTEEGSRYQLTKKAIELLYSHYGKE